MPEDKLHIAREADLSTAEHGLRSGCHGSEPLITALNPLSTSYIYDHVTWFWGFISSPRRFWV
jgi:hypothetical protein